MTETLTTAPKISIIIGVLNMQRYLAAAIDSVIQQNYPNLELIIMDGGSTDGTLDIIRQYESSITIWKSGKDKGHCDACNKAIEFATGDFIGLLNADDILGENLLHKIAALYSQKPATRVITCGVRIMENDLSQNGRIILEITDPEKLQISLHNMLFELPVINARFFHKDIFRNFGKFQATHEDGSYNLSNDRDFLIKLALAGIQSEIISEPLYLYLSHNESLTFSQKNMVKSRKEHIKLAEKFLQTQNLSPNQMKQLQSWLTHESVYLSLIYLKQRQLKNSLATIKSGISRSGFPWLWQLYVVLVKGIFRKSKKLLSSFKNSAVTSKVST